MFHGCMYSHSTGTQQKQEQVLCCTYNHKEIVLVCCQALSLNSPHLEQCVHLPPAVLIFGLLLWKSLVCLCVCKFNVSLWMWYSCNDNTRILYATVFWWFDRCNDFWHWLVLFPSTTDAGAHEEIMTEGWLQFQCCHIFTLPWLFLTCAYICGSTLKNNAPHFDLHFTLNIRRLW